VNNKLTSSDRHGLGLGCVLLLPILMFCFDSASAGQKPVVPAEVSLVEGKDYVRIADGAPLDTATGQVEVAELFNYACPACNGFNPRLLEWKRKLPAYAHVVYVPVDFRPDFVLYARAYYAAESLGLAEKSHEAVYAAVHDTHTLPGEGQQQDVARIARFYVQFGAKADDFQQLMDSFSVNMKVTRARQFAMRSRVNSTPSLVIDGKYLLMGIAWDDMLRKADWLIAKAHTQRGDRAHF
jgi:thiol:disulfide interchange protein DsbA